MKIFNVEKIRAADEYTIKHEPISSIELMERAGIKCAEWILNNYSKLYRPIILAGKGNNAGDGLAIARILSRYGYNCTVLLALGKKGSKDFEINLKRLDDTNVRVYEITDKLKSFESNEKTIWIDAIFGSGLNREIDGDLAELISQVNQKLGSKLSVDIPSGLFADRSNDSQYIFKSDITLTFQFPKMSFFMPENDNYVGLWHVLDIALSNDFITKTSTPYYFIEQVKIASAPRFAHKGTRGRCAIIAGGYGHLGAAILSAKAALHAGIGLVSVQSCQKTIDTLQENLPEALVLNDANEHSLGDFLDYTDQDVIVIGPALGFAVKSKNLFKQIITNYKGQLVIDADAITYLSEQPELIRQLPENTILTPHIGEFDRLFGMHRNHFDRLNTLMEQSKTYKLIIILKGKYTTIANGLGQLFINSTGNNALAKGGSGDILAGLIAGMYPLSGSPLEAAINATYLHGLVGDISATKYGEHYVTPETLLENLHLAQKKCMKIQ